MENGVPTWLIAILLTLLFERGGGWRLYGVAMGSVPQAPLERVAAFILNTPVARQ